MIREEEKMHLERIARWEMITKEVGSITDALGHSIEDNIKPVVIALQALNFSTSQSCEGHVRSEEEDEEHGLLYPWVEVYAPEPDGWRENEEVQEAWRLVNLDLQRRMIGYLEEFYAERTNPFNAQLGFRYIGMFGGFRIQSLEGEVMELLPLEEQKIKYDLYRKEMDDFAGFLKQKYFQ